MIRDGIPFSIRSMVKGDDSGAPGQFYLAPHSRLAELSHVIPVLHGYAPEVRGPRLPCFLWDTLLVQAGLLIEG